MIPFPPPLEDDYKEKIVKAVRAGDLQAKEKLSLAHMRLSVAIAEDYIRRFSLANQRDDLRSAAGLGVLVAVDRIASGYLQHDNATGYIIKFIHSYIMRAWSTLPIVKTPRGHDRVKQQYLLDSHGCRDTSRILHIRETLDSILSTPNERRIVELRMSGHTDAEIAEILRIPRTSILRVRKKLQKRYEKRDLT
jgi:DNA-directed RNA polymerase specialized sigma subunit